MTLDVVRSSSPEIWRSEFGEFSSLLATIGVAIPPGSRIAAFAQASEAFERKEITARDLKSPRLHALLAGARDFSELYLATKALLPTDNPQVKHLFSDALGGSALPVNENRRARTAQFELYLAGLFRANGVPVTFAEPDLVLDVDGVSIGVAAKRIESRKKFRKRLRDGSEQLRKAGLRGLVAVSFDYVGAAEYPGMVGQSLDAISKQVEPRLSGIVDPLRDDILRVVQGRPVMGLLAIVVTPAVVPQENQIGRASATLLRIIEPQVSAEEKQLLIRLASGLRPPTA